MCALDTGNHQPESNDPEKYTLSVPPGETTRHDAGDAAKEATKAALPVIDSKIVAHPVLRKRASSSKKLTPGALPRFHAVFGTLIASPVELSTGQTTYPLVQARYFDPQLCRL
jgi:hypothetical protein